MRTIDELVQCSLNWDPQQIRVLFNKVSGMTDIMSLISSLSFLIAVRYLALFNS